MVQIDQPNPPATARAQAPNNDDSAGLHNALADAGSPAAATAGTSTRRTAARRASRQRPRARNPLRRRSRRLQNARLERPHPRPRCQRRLLRLRRRHREWPRQVDRPHLRPHPPRRQRGEPHRSRRLRRQSLAHLSRHDREIQSRGRPGTRRGRNPLPDPRRNDRLGRRRRPSGRIGRQHRLQPGRIAQRRAAPRHHAQPLRRPRHDRMHGRPRPGPLGRRPVHGSRAASSASARTPIPATAAEFMPD